MYLLRDEKEFTFNVSTVNGAPAGSPVRTCDDLVLKWNIVVRLVHLIGFLYLIWYDNPPLYVSSCYYSTSRRGFTVFER